MPLPAPEEVQAALRATTERLAAELVRPQPCAPHWSEFEWRIARAVAVMHGVSGLLAARLSWRGPPGWAEFLHAQRAHVAAREPRLDALLGALAERCRAQQIALLALKGSALRAAGLYEDGERPMADLDILVAPRDAERAAHVLEVLGLREAQRTLKHRVFVPRQARAPQRFGEHAANDLKVELHERICEQLPRRLTDISELVMPHPALPGLNPYPSRAALMTHLLLHLAGGMAYRTVRLVQLHDVALLARCMSPEEWQPLYRAPPWWALPPLALAARYYGPLAPPELREALAAVCPPRLRRACARQRLTEVSLSRLWIEAFPGIEWARSLSEALGFVARRMAPGRQARAARREDARVDPSLAEGDWGHLSQGRRILRVLTQRTMRPWPLHNVRAALTEPQ
jgi:Uncharacterised nucleotidyltransferase